MQKSTHHSTDNSIAGGAIQALLAAILFGTSMPLAKALLGTVQPFILAGLFYLGSGIGLSIFLVSQKLKSGAEVSQAPIKREDWPWLLGALFFGGVMAELLLMYGLQHSSASSASMLLNLEGVFGALIAWIVFREHTSLRIVVGMVLITLGAVILSLEPNWHLGLSWASLCVVGACLGWGLDNNLTRNISHVDPTQIAAIKGFVAGSVCLALGLSTGGRMPDLATTLFSMLVGLCSYGVSLVLYIFSLRRIGTGRTSAYFSAAPFIGAGASIVFLHDPVTIAFIAATAVIGCGIWLHLTEQHGHEHTHMSEEHEHSHVHDEHHHHEHGPDDPPGEPHVHVHRHEELTHSHAHFPDIHHRHSH